MPLSNRNDFPILQKISPMKKINFTQHILPHGIAVLTFLIVTVFFFNPIFFENKTILQSDIQQSIAASKTLADYRAKTGEEALWLPTMYSGMPAYLVSVQWGFTVIGELKKIMALMLPHPVANIFIAFVSFYILLLSFKIRPYLAIGGALAFGLSSFFIIGLAAGHNGRIGAMAFMPLVLAGIHLTFSGKRVLGFALTAAALSLHLRENHMQVTYYLLIVVVGYGLMQLIVAMREKAITEAVKNVAILIPAALLAVGTYFGPLWALKEYTPYSIRGKAELPSTDSTSQTSGSGVSRDYAFQYSNGITEPLTLIIPNYFGGSSMQYLIDDQESNTYQVLAGSGNQQMANNLARYTSAYWGDQPLAAPYYAGAIITFLFVLGIIFADRKYMWWLVGVSILAVLMSWGKNFETLNFFLFDHLPGYNKFRSVTFILIIVFLVMPLLGMLGVEKFLQEGINKQTKKKLLIALASTGGICLFLLVFGGMLSFTNEKEINLPNWFLNAMQQDRKALLQSDAFRSLAFILVAFVLLYFDLVKKISPAIVFGLLAFFITIDLAAIDKRYFDKEIYKRKRETMFTMSPAEQQVSDDKSYYRVFSVKNDATPSYFFNSITGYHGAKLRRYEDLMQNGLYNNLQAFFEDAEKTTMDYSKYSLINMLNCKYVIYGENKNEVLFNPGATGPAWFISTIATVQSPAEELQKTKDVDTRNVAVLDITKFKAPAVQYDSTSKIILAEHTPRYLKYEAETATENMGVFSEIYYPEGWTATIDGKEAEIIRVNYVLRAVVIPAGKHTIEFTFAPKSYIIGNRITTASSWVVLLVLIASISWTLYKSKD
jgi:hypothetical protein